MLMHAHNQPNPKPRECIWPMRLLSRCPLKRSRLELTRYSSHGTDLITTKSEEEDLYLE